MHNTTFNNKKASVNWYRLKIMAIFQTTEAYKKQKKVMCYLFLM